MKQDDIIKLKHVLKSISISKSETMMLELLNHSDFQVTRHPNSYRYPNTYNFKIYISPTVFHKYFDYKKMIEKELRERIEQSLDIYIEKFQVLVDLEKLEVSEIDVILIQTKWEEINNLQKKLIGLVETSKTSIDFQNIGNTARNIIDLLSREVFDKAKHIPEDSEKEYHNGKYKNQLEGYIKTELSGKENKELRRVADSAIKLVSSTIDIMNLTTHKINGERQLAQLCLVGTLNIVNIIKIISEK